MSGELDWRNGESVFMLYHRALFYTWLYRAPVGEVDPHLHRKGSGALPMLSILLNLGYHCKGRMRLRIMDDQNQSYSIARGPF